MNRDDDKLSDREKMGEKREEGTRHNTTCPLASICYLFLFFCGHVSECTLMHVPVYKQQKPAVSWWQRRAQRKTRLTRVAGREGGRKQKEWTWQQEGSRSIEPNEWQDKRRTPYSTCGVSLWWAKPRFTVSLSLPQTVLINKGAGEALHSFTRTSTWQQTTCWRKSALLQPYRRHEG